MQIRRASANDKPCLPSAQRIACRGRTRAKAYATHMRAGKGLAQGNSRWCDRCGRPQARWRAGLRPHKEMGPPRRTQRRRTLYIWKLGRGLAGDGLCRQPRCSPPNHSGIHNYDSAGCNGHGSARITAPQLDGVVGAGGPPPPLSPFRASTRGPAAQWWMAAEPGHGACSCG